jgi:hypothetical protein
MFTWTIKKALFWITKEIKKNILIFYFILYFITDPLLKYKFKLQSKQSPFKGPVQVLQ